MTLAAAQVVDAVAARLVPLAATGGRVFTDRAWPLEQGDLPAWRVTAQTETVESAQVNDDTNLHQLDIVAEAVARATSAIDDTLHSLAAGGMALLFALPVPHYLQLTSIEREFSGSGEAALGRILISMRATYYVRQSTPETIFS